MESLDTLLVEIADDMIKMGLMVPMDKIESTIKIGCMTRYFGLTEKVKPDKFAIKLSQYILDNPENVKNTIAHELIHTLPGCFNHGKKFIKAAEVMNKTGRYNIKISASKEETESCDIGQALVDAAKYKIICVECGLEIYRLRKSNVTEHPEKYCCPKCKGKIKIEKLNKEK